MNKITLHKKLPRRSLFFSAFFREYHNIKIINGFSMKVSNKYKSVNFFLNFPFIFLGFIKESKKKIFNVCSSSLTHSVMLFNDLLTGNKKEKVSHYGRRRLFSEVGYSLNESSAISLLRVISFFGEKIRFVSQKLNFKFFNHGSHAIKLMNSKNENLTNYAEAIYPTCLNIAVKKVMSLLPDNSYQWQESKKPFDGVANLATCPFLKRLFFRRFPSLDFSNTRSIANGIIMSS